MTLIEEISVTTIDDVATDWVAIAREIGHALQPTVADRDRSGEISRHAFDLLRERGALTALIPREFGGGGASHAEFGAFLRELGRYDGPTAVTLSMHSHLVATQVWRHHHGMDASSFFAQVLDRRAVLISTGASDWVSSSGSARRVEGVTA
jgi:alkylation response protein AidB-like acyl-CoA dehydrogenase